MLAIFAAAVNQRRVTGLSDYSRSVAAALRAGRRFRLNAGRFLRSFAKWKERVSTGIAAVVDGWRSAKAARSVTAALRAHGGCWWSRHERLRSQDLFLSCRCKSLSVRRLHIAACALLEHFFNKNVIARGSAASSRSRIWLCIDGECLAVGMCRSGQKVGNASPMSSRAVYMRIATGDIKRHPRQSLDPRQTSGRYDRPCPPARPCGYAVC